MEETFGSTMHGSGRTMSRTKAKAEFKKNKWPFAVAFDPDLKAAKHFGVERPLPVAYIVGKDGRLKSMPIREFTKRIHSLTFKDMLILADAGKNIPRVDFEETSPRDGANLALIGHAPPAFLYQRIALHSPHLFLEFLLGHFQLFLILEPCDGVIENRQFQME